MKEEVINIRNQAVSQIADCKQLSELDTLRINYLGKNGKLTKLIKNISSLEAGEKRDMGITINETKKVIDNLIGEKRNSLKNSEKGWFDPTVPGEEIETGHLHLVTYAINEIAKIFERIGFNRSRYPEVEWDYYAFGGLNFPTDHPARDEWETFFVDTEASPKYGPMLLTPHTSSGQVREMLRVGKPPIRMVNISKNYRRQLDSTHAMMFHQFEGLVIDEGINIRHLKGTIEYFAKNFYGEGTTSRIRPYHFQFTEPSFEVDFSCVHCGGTGKREDGQKCRFCKEGWHEIGGAGMVHPNVLAEGGIDSKKYSGFAFGWGVERALLLRPELGIDDIRTLYSTNLDYLKQF
jgi:phenylalanyl-tRNA synthetase alpha chain